MVNKHERKAVMCFTFVNVAFVASHLPIHHNTDVVGIYYGFRRNASVALDPRFYHRTNHRSLTLFFLYEEILSST